MINSFNIEDGVTLLHVATVLDNCDTLCLLASMVYRENYVKVCVSTKALIKIKSVVTDSIVIAIMFAFIHVRVYIVGYL